MNLLFLIVGLTSKFITHIEYICVKTVAGGDLSQFT